MTRTVRIGSIGVLVALGLGLGGCSDSGDSPEGPAAEEEGGSAGATSTCTGGDERCVDEWGAVLCPVETGFMGDDLAQCEPEAGKGLLFHYGPSDYDDPDEVAKYMLEAGGEDENCIFIKTTNTEPVYMDTFHGRMRPGSHHLIVTVVDQLDPGVVLGQPTACQQTGAVGARWLLGSQDPQIDIGAGGGGVGMNSEDPGPVEGDPDYRTGQLIEAGTILRIDMHYINTFDADILREAWIYVNTIPEDEVDTLVDMITFFQGEINVPPKSTGTTTGVAPCVAPTDRYVGLMTGHFHENGTRFTIWHTNTAGERNMVYETFDWEDPGNAFYADRRDNPSFDDATSAWGATDGYLQVKAGESIDFQCEFDNPTDVVVGLGDTGRDQMCNVFGFYYPSDGNVWSCGCIGSNCI